MKKDTIVWDWNGTLLDDVKISLEGINILLKQRNLPSLNMERYLKIFSFPVKDYYEAAGFDFSREFFEVPAEEYILQYKRLLPQAGLFPDVRDTLSLFRKKGFRQYIISAMEHEALLQSVRELEAEEFFDSIFGLEDNLAFSKVHLGKRLFESEAIEPEKAIMVGDTLHDAEVAKELEIDMIFISRGHQSAQRLQTNGNLIFPDLVSFRNYLIK